MILKTFNTLEKADVSPAEAGTPYGAKIQQGKRHGVPPSGGEVYTNTMTTKTFNALDNAIAPPAEAGTPNPEIQQGMKELEGMLK